MISVAPMADELAIGHEGRIAWVYGVTEKRELDHHLAATLPHRDVQKSAKTSRLTQLAVYARLSPTEYAKKHSMLPVFRVAAKHGEDLIHGCEQGESFSRRLSPRVMPDSQHCTPWHGSSQPNIRRAWPRCKESLQFPSNAVARTCPSSIWSKTK